MPTSHERPSGRFDNPRLAHVNKAMIDSPGAQQVDDFVRYVSLAILFLSYGRAVRHSNAIAANEQLAITDVRPRPELQPRKVP